MKFNIGDKVRLRSDYKVNKVYNEVTLFDFMVFDGEGTVTGVEGRLANVRPTNSTLKLFDYTYDVDMLVKVVKPLYEVGDKVKLKPNIVAGKKYGDLIVYTHMVFNGVRTIEQVTLYDGDMYGYLIDGFWYTANVLEPAQALEAKIETQPTHPKFEDTVRKFSTGAVRDTSEGKPRMGLIPKDLLRRVSKLYTKGAEMYGADNWRKGQPKDTTMDSLERHLEAYRRGETDEDHLSAVIWNAFSMMNVDEYLLEEHPELDFEFKYPKKKATSIDTILRRYREGR